MKVKTNSHHSQPVLHFKDRLDEAYPGKSEGALLFDAFIHSASEERIAPHQEKNSRQASIHLQNHSNSGDCLFKSGSTLDQLCRQFKNVTPEVATQLTIQQLKDGTPSYAELLDDFFITADVPENSERDTTKQFDDALHVLIKAKHDALALENEERHSLIEKYGDLYKRCGAPIPKRLMALDSEFLQANNLLHIPFGKKKAVKLPHIQSEPSKQRLSSKGHRRSPKLHRTEDVQSIIASKNVLPLTTTTVLVTPKSIVFSEYTPHKRHKAEFTLLNVTSKPIRCRVTTPPPYKPSTYFTIISHENPVEGDGMLATGMRSKYTVWFTPDSLQDFYQEFIVQPEFGQSFPFSVSGIREKPKLSLSDSIYLGSITPGQTLKKVILVENSGGRTRFVFQGKRESPANHSQFWEDVQRGPQSFSKGPFTILHNLDFVCKQEKVEVTFIYEPKPLELDLLERVDEQVFSVIFDNLTSKSIKVAAKLEIPRVTFLQVDNSLIKGEDIVIGEKNVGSKTSMALKIKNECDYGIPYTWIVNDSPKSNKKRLAGHDAFQVTPSSGLILANETRIFDLRFEPNTIRKFDCSVEMMLQNNDHYARLLNIRCLAESCPFLFQIVPPFIRPPLAIPMGHSYTTEFSLVNNSAGEADYDIRTRDLLGKIDISISPRKGKIAKSDSVKVAIHITARYPGRVNGFLDCIITKGGALSIPIQAMVDLNRNAIEVGASMIDFGCMKLDEFSVAKLRIRNCHDQALEVGIGMKEACADGDAIVGVIPSQMRLDVGEKIECQIAFASKRCIEFKGSLEWGIRTAALCSDQFVSLGATRLYATVTSPCASTDLIQYNVAAIACIPHMTTLCLKNDTGLLTSFSWKHVLDDDCSIEVKNAEGTLLPFGEQIIDIAITFNKPGHYEKILKCYIPEMLNNNGYIAPVIKAVVDDFRPKVLVMGHETEAIEFPGPIHPYDLSSCDIEICNPSEARVYFDLLFKQNGASDALFAEMERIDGETKQETCFVKREEVGIGFKSETGKEYIKKVYAKNKTDKILKGRSVAFRTRPSNGYIDPFDKVKVVLEGYNRASGYYFDLLQINIKGVHTQAVPVSMRVSEKKQVN